MTQPKLATMNLQTGDREYINPDGDAFLGVTTILGVLPKMYLTAWSAKVTAETAAYLMEDLVSNIKTEDDSFGNEYLAVKGDCLVDQYITEVSCFDTDEFADDLKRAYEWERDAAGTLGDEVHDACESIMRISKGNPEIAAALYEDAYESYSPEAQRRLRWFIQWLSENEVVPLELEATTYNDTHRYAGSFDLCAIVNGVTRYIDYKTSKHLDPSTALQLSAYSRGEYVAIKENDGRVSRHPMPVTYTPDVKAAVLHLQPTQCRMIEADISDKVYDAFLTCLLLKRGWMGGLSKEVTKNVLYTTKPKKSVKEEEAAWAALSISSRRGIR